MIFIPFFEGCARYSIIKLLLLSLIIGDVSALYTILGVRHLLSKGHLFLSLQLHPYSVFSEYKIVVVGRYYWTYVWETSITDFYFICIKYAIHWVRRWKMSSKQFEKYFTYICLHTHRVWWVVPHNILLAFPRLVTFFFNAITCWFILFINVVLYIPMFLSNTSLLQ